MNHFTDRKGHEAIRAVSPWRFRARRQRGGQPFGAYFTTLELSAPNFFQKVRVPVKKRRFVFRFEDAGDLLRYPGPRGRYVLYSPTDYLVKKPRQQYDGPA
jgi:hypothetical protein